MPEYLRRVRLSPYLKGRGPTFTLTTWDTGRRDDLGKSVLRYELVMLETRPRSVSGFLSSQKARTVLFAGADLACSPCYAIDSDKSLAALLGFLTLRPGETDAEYFDAYTDVQRRFCEEHAATLALESLVRFGED